METSPYILALTAQKNLYWDTFIFCRTLMEIRITSPDEYAPLSL